MRKNRRGISSKASNFAAALHGSEEHYAANTSSHSDSQVHTCVAPGCLNRKGTMSCKKKGIRFYKFPSNEEQKKTWLTNMRCVNWTPAKHSCVCSEHFAKNCFKGRTGRLTEFAVPTIFNFPKVDRAVSHYRFILPKPNYFCTLTLPVNDKNSLSLLPVNNRDSSTDTIASIQPLEGQEVFRSTAVLDDCDESDIIDCLCDIEENPAQILPNDVEEPLEDKEENLNVSSENQSLVYSTQEDDDVLIVSLNCRNVGLQCSASTGINSGCQTQDPTCPFTSVEECQACSHTAKLWPYRVYADGDIVDLDHNYCEVNTLPQVTFTREDAFTLMYGDINSNGDAFPRELFDRASSPHSSESTLSANTEDDTCSNSDLDSDQSNSKPQLLPNVHYGSVFNKQKSQDGFVNSVKLLRTTVKPAEDLSVDLPVITSVAGNVYLKQDANIPASNIFFYLQPPQNSHQT